MSMGNGNVRVCYSRNAYIEITAEDLKRHDMYKFYQLNYEVYLWGGAIPLVGAGLAMLIGFSLEIFVAKECFLVGLILIPVFMFGARILWQELLKSTADAIMALQSDRKTGGETPC